MESKHKNALIGALLAVVFVMAVGYAAFATTLTINGTAEITSKWDIRFDNSKTTPTIYNGKTGAAATEAAGNPTGSITYADNDITANLTATLVQPGDKVTYVLTPHNYGTITAVTTGPKVFIEGGVNRVGASTTADAQNDVNTASASDANAVTVDNGSYTRTVGNIKYTVRFTPKGSVGTNADDNDITVEVEYVFTDNQVVEPHAAALKVTLLYNQA